ncbi:hypothetical protein KY385_00925 [Candidatus Parcubacteria bacterium]|nr:hypothetical protein [Candidatus Parcubacteria bacterium]
MLRGLHVAISTSAVESDPFNESALEAFNSIGCNQSVVPYTLVPESVEMLEAADSVTVLGTPLHYSKKTAELLRPYFEPLKNANIKRWLGICAGMQVMGLLYGAEMKRGEEVEIGRSIVKAVDGQETDLLLSGLGKYFFINNLHTASLDINDAPDVVHVASSLKTPGVTETGCEVQIMRVLGKNNWYGIQGHPEKGFDGLKILRNFLDLPQPEYVDSDNAFNNHEYRTRQNRSGLWVVNGQDSSPPHPSMHLPSDQSIRELLAA